MKQIYRGAFAAAALIAAAVSHQSVAQKPRSLEITHTDGTHFSVALSSSLTMQFTDEALLLSDSRAALDLCVPRERLASFALSAEEAGVDVVEQDSGVDIKLVGSELVVMGLKPGMAAEVFSTDGKMIQMAESDAEGMVSVRLSELPHGVCLIKVGECVTYKFTKR